MDVNNFKATQELIDATDELIAKHGNDLSNVMNDLDTLYHYDIEDDGGDHESFKKGIKAFVEERIDRTNLEYLKDGGIGAELTALRDSNSWDRDKSKEVISGMIMISDKERLERIVTTFMENSADENRSLFKTLTTPSNFQEQLGMYLAEKLDHESINYDKKTNRFTIGQNGNYKYMINPAGLINADNRDIVLVDGINTVEYLPKEKGAYYNEIVEKHQSEVLPSLKMDKVLDHEILKEVVHYGEILSENVKEYKLDDPNLSEFKEWKVVALAHVLDYPNSFLAKELKKLDPKLDDYQLLETKHRDIENEKNQLQGIASKLLKGEKLTKSESDLIPDEFFKKLKGNFWNKVFRVNKVVVVNNLKNRWLMESNDKLWDVTAEKVAFKDNYTPPKGALEQIYNKGLIKLTALNELEVDREDHYYKLGRLSDQELVKLNEKKPGIINDYLNVLRKDEEGGRLRAETLHSKLEVKKDDKTIAISM